MKSNQRGGSTLSSLVSAILIIGCIYWWFSDYLPARAEDLQDVVSLAATSTEAEAIVVAGLKETPNPNRIELRRMRNHVNEIIVTETARKVTGDKTLETPSERNERNARQAAVRLSEIESKSLWEMSNEERAVFFISKWQITLGLPLIFIIVLFGFRFIRQAARGY